MTERSPGRAVLTAGGLLLVSALIVRDAATPPTPVAATAPATRFSAERALVHVRAIAQRPHPTGSPDNARVRAYVLEQLRALGLDPQVQDATGVGTRYPEAGHVQNILARLPGRSPGGQSVVLMAHYDGVGGGPAASDDAAGTAAVLETLRALRAGPALAHDVIALITDGEEAGLLGAAAFVREHPWARDVGVTLNVEARGTRGRSYMFETGPGNLDAVRMLRAAPDPSATSLSVTVYRSMPNDTDLSEMAMLGRPALNFAFADGVERYHTARDDIAHLDPGSLQHHGAQMLALARAFGNGPLPRPATGDAVFFDVPLLGLIVYPETWALPIALLAAALVIIVVVRVARSGGRWIRGLVLGIAGTVVGTAASAVVIMFVGNAIARVHDATGWRGAPAFRGIYTAALAALALAIALAGWALVRRWATARAVHAGALVVWGALTLVVTLRLPGVSFLLAWPLIAAASAAAMSVRRDTAAAGARGGDAPAAGAASALAWWIASLVAIVIIVPITYAVSAVMLGAVGAGGIAAAVLTGLAAWLIAPHLEQAEGERRWLGAAVIGGTACLLIVVGLVTVRSSAAHPTPSVLAYAIDPRSSAAWIATRGPITVSPDSTAVPADSVPNDRPRWLLAAFGAGPSVSYAPAPRVPIEPPRADVRADSVTPAGRRLVLTVRAMPGTELVSLRSPTRVLQAQVDGRTIDTSRYRRTMSEWRLDYSAPPDSGFTLAVTVPPGAALVLDLTARSRGLPDVPGVRLPTRPPDVVTVQTGDVTLVHGTVRIE